MRTFEISLGKGVTSVVELGEDNPLIRDFDAIVKAQQDREVELLATKRDLKRSLEALAILPEICEVLESSDWSQSDIQQFTNEIYDGAAAYRELSKVETAPGDGGDGPESYGQIARQRDRARLELAVAHKQLAACMDALDLMTDASDAARDPEGYYYTLAANTVNTVRGRP